MLDALLTTNLYTGSSTSAFTFSSFILCTVVSLGLGLAIASVYMFRNPYSKSIVLSIVLLPVIVQVVILLVNGNLGTGLAVMGAFSLIRFRSAAGTARDITSLFLAMAVGLATGIGYLCLAVLLTVIACLALLLLTVSSFGDSKKGIRNLRIVIPESLEYTEVFDDIFNKYLSRRELVSVKTTNMGSLYKLEYSVSLRNPDNEKAMIDELRCRNGNLEISCGKAANGREEL